MFLVPNVEVRRTPGKGRGVFAVSPIVGGTVIGDYLGKIIRPKDENEKEQGLYSMYITDRMTVLANPRKYGLHLVNHSCEPNCAMYVHCGHTIFFALRKIFKGEELVISYYIGPPDKDCNPCLHECKCGSDFCSGTMHNSKEQSDVYYRYTKKIMRKNGKYRLGSFGTEITPLKQYPKIVPDQSIYSIFACNHKEPIWNASGKLPPVRELRRNIRNTGRRIAFSKLGFVVRGVIGKYSIVSSV